MRSQLRKENISKPRGGLDSSQKVFAFLKKLQSHSAKACDDPSSMDVVIMTSEDSIRKFLFPSGTLRRLADLGLIKFVDDEITLAPSGDFLKANGEAIASAVTDSGASPYIRRARAQEALVNLRESPLAWLYARRNRKSATWISDAQFDAGERLREDFTFGQITNGFASMRWGAEAASGTSGRAGSGLQELTDAKMAARKRFEGALQAVGQELSGVLVDVCCHLKGVEVIESERRWPARSAKVVLLLALSRLARHYGFVEKEHDGGGKVRRDLCEP